MNRSTRAVFAGLIVASLLWTSGCKQGVDLSAVQVLATQTSAGKPAFDAVSADFYDSCVRAKRYEYAADPTAIQNIVTLCAKNRAASELWQAANGVLLGYVASLGSLATDKTTDFGLGKLAAAIGAAPGSSFGAARQSAVAAAGNGLLGAAYAARRRDALAPIMEQAQTPNPGRQCPQGCLLDLIASLESIAQTQYATQLSIEDTAIYAFYEPNISAGLRVKGVSAMTAFGYEVSESDARGAVAARKASIATYVAALDQIATAHAGVVRAIRANDIGDVGAVVNGFVATYSAKVEALKKAFAEK